MAMSTASDVIKLVVFNACFSEAQAENVVTYVDSAIGMGTSISDEAACVFAAQLYTVQGTRVQSMEMLVSSLINCGWGYEQIKGFIQKETKKMVE